MKIALITPPPRREMDKHWARYPALGLAYVASSLRARGHEIVVLDGKLGQLSPAEIHERIMRVAPDVVGITCMTIEFPTAVRIAIKIKSAGSRVPIVLGGPHVNAVGAHVLEECSAVDFACVGEGEHLACELVDALGSAGNLAEIRGLAYRCGGRVIKNAPREYHDDYDALPFPAWDLFQVGKQIPLLTHRGCPFQCNFCGHNSGFKPRYRSPDNVLTEIEYVVARFAPETIRIEDETFGLNLPRTKKILEGILERGLNRRVGFSAQTRVDRVDAEFVRLLKDCSFETLELGVESGNADVLRRMGKGISLCQVEHAVRLAKAQGLRVWCKFIVGHPYETAREMRDTANFIARLNPDGLSVSIMTPFPGTPIFDMAVRGEGGYRLLSRDWENFDKYASGALELQGVSLSKLKAYQIWCYLKLYLWNGRVRDLVRLATGHRLIVWEILVELVSSVVRCKAAGGPVDRRTHAEPPATPLSDVAMLDSTLVQLRRRSGEPSLENLVDKASKKPLRTWASPGA